MLAQLTLALVALSSPATSPSGDPIAGVDLAKKYPATLDWIEGAPAGAPSIQSRVAGYFFARSTPAIGSPDGDVAGDERATSARVSCASMAAPSSESSGAEPSPVPKADQTETSNSRSAWFRLVF